MKLTLISILMFSFFHSFGQSSYLSTKKKMQTSCQDTFSAARARHDIELFSIFTSRHVNHADSWYQLSNLYYQSGIYHQSDSLMSLAINAAHNYTAFAKNRHKWIGYWNIALWSAYLSECENFNYFIKLADKLCKGNHKKYWDEESARNVSKFCEQTKIE